MMLSSRSRVICRLTVSIVSPSRSAMSWRPKGSAKRKAAPVRKKAPARRKAADADASAEATVEVSGTDAAQDLAEADREVVEADPEESAEAFMARRAAARKKPAAAGAAGGE